MKKIIVVLTMVFVFCGLAQAAEVTLTWNPVDFAVCGSDPAQSGYKLYKSTDEGETKTLTGSVDSTVLSFSYTETGNAKLCYFATAYNQFGESGYSEPACVYVSNVPPAAPTGLDAVIKVLQEISQTLQTIAGKM